jgi:hypothetical protein
MNEKLVIDHKSNPQVMYRLAWGEHPASQRRHKLDGFVINDPTLNVVEPINATIRSHGDLTFMNFFAFNTVGQGHGDSLFSD